MSSDVRVVIVDKDDNPISLKTRDEIKYEDIYRVSALWLSDGRSGDCLITQRKWSKHHDPGKWMAAASGTIEEGETYEYNVVHEIEEEIGLTALSFTKGPRKYVDDGQHRFFVQWFIAQADKNKITIKIQEEEVEDYAWVPLKVLIKDLHNNPDKYVPTMREGVELLGLT